MAKVKLKSEIKGSEQNQTINTLAVAHDLHHNRHHNRVGPR